MRLREADNDTVLFEGTADNVAFNPLNNVASVRGRDYSSTLINSTYQASYCNQTASEIVGAVAERHGFLENITETSKLIGSYQNSDYNQVLLNAHSRITTEWDLLVHLAKLENFQLFLDGTTLVFSPSGDLLRNRIKIDKSIVKDIRFSQVCQPSDKGGLIVKSWNSWLGQVSLYADSQSYEPTVTNGIGLDDGSGSEIAIIRPNLTSQDAEQLSQRCQRSLKEWGLNVEVSMPGELNLKPNDVMSIGGSGTSFDSDYIVRSVRRQFSPTAGFVQHVQGFVPETSVISSSAVSIS